MTTDDTHSEFGGHTTYRGTASYNFADTGTRLHASAGTGFRAPDLHYVFTGPGNDETSVTDYYLGNEARFQAPRKTTTQK